jgi:ubiquinone/menaquinone biosynthesis C-methylase UbiE
MRRPGRYLTAEQARRVYDRIGRVQDLQAVYEHRAITDLLAHADFEHANAVFELGYGTGSFAARLLARDLPAGSVYLGTDISPKMQKLARRRLGGQLARAEVHLSDGSLHLPFEDAAFDRFVAAYVLDLFSDDDIALTLREARRLLVPDGLLCLVSLTFGATPAARSVTRLWRAIWSLRPELVGGCRPIRLANHLDTALWTIRHHAVVTTIGISSEVLVAAQTAPLDSPAGSGRRSPSRLRTSSPCFPSASASVATGNRRASSQPAGSRGTRCRAGCSAGL